MQLANLAMPGYNTTLIGVVKGVLNYFALPASDGRVFGVSGHAFLLNIHPELCPSGPYCWDMSGFLWQIRCLGVEMQPMGFYSAESSAEERGAVEDRVRAQLDGGSPCSLLNMEHQLITGYDDTGFFTAQPWAPHVDFPPAHLTFGSWQELGAEIHVSFFTFTKRKPAPEALAIRESLRYAVSLVDSATLHPEGGVYAGGLAAYDNWIGAIAQGAGNSHGNWWNGTVWSECRQRAGQYFHEIAGSYPAIAPRATALATDYSTLGHLLHRVSDKALPADEQIALLREARELEARCIPLLAELAEEMPEGEE